MISIFNNGSHSWILFVLEIIWIAVLGYRTYKSHKSGYNYQGTDQYGDVKYTDVSSKGQLIKNGNFKMLVWGTIVLTGFLIWINSEYANPNPTEKQKQEYQKKWEKQKAKGYAEVKSRSIIYG